MLHPHNKHLATVQQTLQLYSDKIIQAGSNVFSVLTEVWARMFLWNFTCWGKGHSFPWLSACLETETEDKAETRTHWLSPEGRIVNSVPQIQIQPWFSFLPPPEVISATDWPACLHTCLPGKGRVENQQFSALEAPEQPSKKS